MKCKNCNNEPEGSVLDTDGICYNCANGGEAATDMTEAFKELINTTINGLADVKKTTPEKLKTDFVNAGIINNTRIKKKNEQN